MSTAIASEPGRLPCPDAVEPDVCSHQAAIDALRITLNEALIGKADVVELVLACLLARGHLLFDDLPGLGKTTLAKALAQAVGGVFARVQCTPDLLPSDVTGFNVLNQKTREFEFHEGPVFSDVLLADEINRATPRTQSALFEAMAERQVTIDRQTHPLSDSFFVIATQNPVDLSGTFPLPDSQLDRFLLRISMGYPDAVAERAMLSGRDRRLMINETLPRLGAEDVLALQKAVDGVHASDALLDYVQRLLLESRRHAGVRVGLSPRAGLALLRGARAHALLLGRAHALPDDVQALFVAVAAHRLVADIEGDRRVALAASILGAVAVD